MHHCADSVLTTKDSMGTKSMQACSNPSRQGCPWLTPRATLVLTKGRLHTSLGVNLVSRRFLGGKKGLVHIRHILKNFNIKGTKRITSAGCKPVERPWQSGQRVLLLLLHSSASAPCCHQHASPGPEQARTICMHMSVSSLHNETVLY